MAFLVVKTFFWCVFKNTEQNNNCVFIVLKAESEPKHEENENFDALALAGAETLDLDF